MITTKSDQVPFEIRGTEPAVISQIRKEQERAVEEGLPIPVFDITSRLKDISKQEVWVYHYTSTEYPGFFRLHYVERKVLPDSKRVVDEPGFYEEAEGPLYSLLSPSGEGSDNDGDDYAEMEANAQLHLDIMNRQKFMQSRNSDIGLPTENHAAHVKSSETNSLVLKHAAIGLFIAGVLKHV